MTLCRLAAIGILLWTCSCLLTPASVAPPSYLTPLIATSNLSCFPPPLLPCSSAHQHNCFSHPSTAASTVTAPSPAPDIPWTLPPKHSEMQSDPPPSLPAPCVWPPFLSFMLRVRLFFAWEKYFIFDTAPTTHPPLADTLMINNNIIIGWDCGKIYSRRYTAGLVDRGDSKGGTVL